MGTASMYFADRKGRLQDLLNTTLWNITSALDHVTLHGQTVVSADNDIDDYWMVQSSAPKPPSTPALSVLTIKNVEPLDAQFGVADPLTVPAALQGALFGQPEPTETELAGASGDTSKVLPLHTFAILDAAKVKNLPEMLETSGLEHRCLFKGDAFDKLKDVAPWIVRLEEGNSFTRNLFTRSDAPWHLWDAEPGIYIRSRTKLDVVWAHFRKFTRVQDEYAKWYYWRFWEPKWTIGQLSDMQPDQINRFLPLGFQVIVISSNGKVELISKETFDF